MPGTTSIAVDNIGDNWHNLLLQLFIFLTAAAAPQTSHLTKLSEKASLLGLCLKSDSCRNVGFSARDSRMAMHACGPRLNVIFGVGRIPRAGSAISPPSRRGLARRTTSDAELQVAGRLFPC